MTITIYGLPHSTYTRTVLMTCLEKAVPFELDETGLTPIANLKKRSHRARHPFGMIPAIRDREFLLYETSAICRYIDETRDGPSLTPSGSSERALMEQWISVTNAYVDGDFIRRCVLHYAFPRGENGEPDQAVIDSAVPGIRRSLQVLNEAYGKEGFLVAGALTLADLFLAPILFYLERTPIGPGLLDGAPNVRRGLRVLAERSSFANVMHPETAIRW